MVKIKSERLKRWAWVTGWTLLIYSTLYLVRLVSNALKKILPYSLFINVFLGIILTGIGGYAWRVINIRRPLSWLLLAAALGCYIYGIIVIKYPDEKIHFLQYGILAWLVFNALRYDFSRLVSYLGALLITFCIGWGDELIQGLLPNRYYDIKDVWLNGISGALGLLLVFVREREAD